MPDRRNSLLQHDCLDSNSALRISDPGDQPGARRRIAAPASGCEYQSVHCLETRLRFPDPLSARQRLGVRRHLQSRRDFRPREIPCRRCRRRQIRDALPRPGRSRHLAPRLCRKHRWHPLHAHVAEPVLSPAAEYEKDGGVEDPRLSKNRRTYYFTYTGYNKKDAQLCLATSHDLLQWERQGVILPGVQRQMERQMDQVRRDLPEKIDGKYWMYWLGTAADKTDQMGLSYSDDLLHWTEATERLFSRAARENLIRASSSPARLRSVTPMASCLSTTAPTTNSFIAPASPSSISANPRKLISRTEEPIFAPEKNWEKVGQVPNVVFVEGMAAAANTQSGRNDFLFYYGAADKYVGVARARLQLPSSKPNDR